MNLRPEHTFELLAGREWMPVAHSRGGQVILVVEDEDPVRFVLTETLEGEGYVVLAASSGAEAVQLYANHPEVALVLTDVAMPGMTGPQMVEEMRRSGPDIPVVMLSGYADATAEWQNMLDAKTKLVPKPFDLDELLEVVREMVSDGA